MNKICGQTCGCKSKEECDMGGGEVKQENNPRMQCHDCGKWMRLFAKGKRQLFFAGDSVCGSICVDCIEKHKAENTYAADKTICKRRCGFKCLFEVEKGLERCEHECDICFKDRLSKIPASQPTAEVYFFCNEAQYNNNKCKEQCNSCKDFTITSTSATVNRETNVLEAKEVPVDVREKIKELALFYFMENENFSKKPFETLLKIGTACYSIAASTIREQQNKIASLSQALKTIAEWKLPETGEYWDKEKTRPLGYEAAYGSKGAKDYMKSVAQLALNKL